MQPHTKIYLKEMGFHATEFIPCEVCGVRATEIHHIKARGMGGRKNADVIENLMAVCRSCHITYGDKKQFMDFLNQKHQDAVTKAKQRRNAI